jgi:hypothetical protein
MEVNENTSFEQKVTDAANQSKETVTAVLIRYLSTGALEEPVNLKPQHRNTVANSSSQKIDTAAPVSGAKERFRQWLEWSANAVIALGVCAGVAWWNYTKLLPEMMEQAGALSGGLIILCLFGPYLLINFAIAREEGGIASLIPAKGQVFGFLVIHLMGLGLSILIFGPWLAAIFFSVFGPGGLPDCDPGVPSRYC